MSFDSKAANHASDTCRDRNANQRWLNNVTTPSSARSSEGERYHLAIVGAGPAGLVAAAGAAGLGAKVALIESEKMGGDCLNNGCVPSKTLLNAARRASEHSNISEDDIVRQKPLVHFDRVMNRVETIRADLSEHDSVHRFNELGVDVFMGRGSFTSPESLEVNGETINFKRALIATGARASKLRAPGFQDIEMRTNEDIFSLNELPKRLIVIGGGAIGCELAQAFARLGSSVVQIEKASRLLQREDADASKLIQASLEQDGVKILLNSSVESVSKDGTDKVVLVKQNGSKHQFKGDEILVSVGRSPNVQHLNLEKANVKFDEKHGVEVNDFLQTSNPKIYAAGDISTAEKFTHAADFMSRIVVQNSLFMGRSRFSSLIIPRCTYTSPEVAHVGFNPLQANDGSVPVHTFTETFSHVDRAVIDGRTDGFARIHVKKGTDKIIGATIVGQNAGDHISMITMAIKHRIGMKKIAATIFPYPTQADVIRRLGDQYNRTRLTPRVKNLMSKWLAWTR